MDRLTMDKPIEEMNMTELALNCCYIKDGKARYRDYETDMDARDFVRNLLLDYNIVNGENEVLTDNVAFDFAMVGWLIHNPKQAKGLIALFYRTLWAMAELRERLKYYEELEEQGRLVRQQLGRWEKDTDDPKDGNYTCSCCKEGVDIATGEETPLDRGLNYCPNCGAKM